MLDEKFNQKKIDYLAAIHYLFYEFFIKHEYIIFYGAGEFGKIFADYCKMNHQKIDAFIVSDDQRIPSTHYDAIPIFPLATLPFPKEKCGVLLTAEEKYYDVLKANLKKNGFKFVYSPTSCLQNELFQQCNALRKMKDIQYETEAIASYQRKAEKLKKQYCHFEFCYIDVTRIANMIELLLETDDNRFGLKDTLNIFIPYSYQYNCLEFLADKRSANTYLLHKMQEKLELITEDTAAFWKFFMETYPENISFYDRYSHANMMLYEGEDLKNDQICRPKRWCAFTTKEHFLGKHKMLEMGMDKEFVCFFARSNKYLQTIFKGASVRNSHTVRNSSVQNFLLTTQCLCRENIQSVRMGHPQEEPIEGEGIIDYANKYREEFMDLYLIANCRFLIMGYSGLQYVAAMFCKPIVIINATVLNPAGDLMARYNPKTDIMIIKKRWDRMNQRYLSLKEILQIEELIQDNYKIVDYYIEQQIELIENTPEEIWDAVQEMLQRQNGTVYYSQEDIYLQNKYREIFLGFAECSKKFDCRVPLGAKFLRDNQWLLD